MSKMVFLSSGVTKKRVSIPDPVNARVLRGTINCPRVDIRVVSMMASILITH
ncbi:MAG: hypothetical protein AABW68_03195 [archaeon]